MKKHATTTKMALAWLLAAALFSMPGITAADVVGYWRMETDNDDDPESVSIPNEIPGGTPLTSAEAQIHNHVPIHPVPWTGAENLGSLDPIYVGGWEGIYATVAEYGALNVDSITVEFWCRTLEHTGSLVTRRSGSTGFEILKFDDVQVRYFVDDGAGGAAEVLLHPDNSNTIDLDDTWVHLAWTYDAAAGIGRLYADGVLKAEDDGPDDRALVWGNEDMSVGYRMDGHEPPVITDGLFDELRVSDRALCPQCFLNAQDTTPPDVACSVNPEELWPPNHRMVPVIAVVEAEDICTETQLLDVSVTVTSNEPDDDKGDGAFTGDVDGQDGCTAPVPVTWEYDADAEWFVCSFELRAERAAPLAGRVYTIRVECTDVSGNTATATEEVIVPHDQGKGKK